MCNKYERKIKQLPLTVDGLPLYECDVSSILTAFSTKGEHGGYFSSEDMEEIIRSSDLVKEYPTVKAGEGVDFSTWDMGEVDKENIAMEIKLRVALDSIRLVKKSIKPRMDRLKAYLAAANLIEERLLFSSIDEDLVRFQLESVLVAWRIV